MLSTQRVLTLLEELVEMGTLSLTLTGGELFLRKDWLTVARRARQLGFALRLFSNGSLIDEQLARDIEPLHATVEISLYAMRRETFEEITRRPGSFRADPCRNRAPTRARGGSAAQGPDDDPQCR